MVDSVRLVLLANTCSLVYPIDEIAMFYVTVDIASQFQINRCFRSLLPHHLAIISTTINVSRAIEMLLKARLA